MESEAFLTQALTNGAGDDQGRQAMHRHLHQGAIIFSTKEQNIFWALDVAAAEFFAPTPLAMPPYPITTISQSKLETRFSGWWIERINKDMQLILYSRSRYLGIT